MIAEQQEVGPCLESVLEEHGYVVTTEDSYAADETGSREFELIIATNTSLTPSQILRLIPAVKARHSDAWIIVLSGYCAEEWVADLKRTGIDRFLELPFEVNALLKEVAGLLSTSQS